MVWVLIAVFIYAIIFVAGGAHSRYLDRLETRRRVVMTIQLFNVSPDIVSPDIAKDTEFTVDLTSEAIHNIPIESLESFIESLESFSVRNESETCVRPPAADNRTFNHGIRLVPGEGELHEAYIEPLGSFIEALESFSVRNESETCVSSPAADNRTFNHGIRPVPGEGELHEAYAETAAEGRGVAIITNSNEERGGRKIEPASAPLGENMAVRLN